MSTFEKSNESVGEAFCILRNDMGGIYMIRWLHDYQKVYIGSTINFKNRFKRHLNDMKRGKHSNGRLQNMYNKYGGSVVFVILYETEDNLIEHEQIYVNYYSDCGLNIMNLSKVISNPMYDRDIAEKHRNIMDTYYSNPENMKQSQERAKRLWTPEFRERQLSLIQERYANTDFLKKYKNTCKVLSKQRVIDDPEWYKKFREARVQCIIKPVVNLTTLVQYTSIKDASITLKISAATISNRCRKTTGITEGDAWMFLSEYLLGDTAIANHLAALKSRKLPQKVRCKESGVEYDSCKNAGVALGVKSCASIYQVCKGIRKRAFGLTWEFV